MWGLVSESMLEPDTTGRCFGREDGCGVKKGQLPVQMQQAELQPPSLNWDPQEWTGTCIVPYCLQVSNLDAKSFPQEKPMPLCHTAKRKTELRVGELRTGDSIDSGGVKHLAAATLQPRSQEATPLAGAATVPSMHQPSQLQKPARLSFTLLSLGLSWLHEGKVDSGKCPSLAKLTQHKSPTTARNAYGRNEEKSARNNASASIFVPFLPAEWVRSIF